MAFRDKKHGIIVGGDYKNDSLKKDAAFYTSDGGKHWSAPATPARGYRECIEYISSDTCIAVGPGGIDFSTDDGHNWAALSDEKQFHVLRKSRKGSLFIMAGGGGKIARFNATKK